MNKPFKEHINPMVNNLQRQIKMNSLWSFALLKLMNMFQVSRSAEIQGNYYEHFITRPLLVPFDVSIKLIFSEFVNISLHIGETSIL